MLLSEHAGSVHKLAKKKNSSNIFTLCTKKACSIKFLLFTALLWICWQHSTFISANANCATEIKTYIYFNAILQRLCQNVWPDNKERFILYTKMFSLEYLFKKANHWNQLMAAHLSALYSKIWNAQGTNQNAPFHHGPVQTYNNNYW